MISMNVIKKGYLYSAKGVVGAMQVAVGAVEIC